MPERDFELPLDDDAKDWIRLRFTTEGGQVTRFTAQYETTIDGKRTPVIRYDNAHEIAHRDRLNRRGEVIEKTSMDATTLGEALNQAQHAINSEWQTYLTDLLGTDA